jgi:hypothetical protein
MNFVRKLLIAFLVRRELRKRFKSYYDKDGSL